MSRKKKRWRPVAFKGPAIGPLERKTNVAPSEVHPPTPEAARELGRKEGRSSMLGEQQKMLDEKIDQVRADAQAMETAARIMEDASILLRAQRDNVVSSMFAMAAGMRLAVSRFPHSDDCPF